MELGMGIHGESGAQKLKLLPCRQAIDLAIGQLALNSRTFHLNSGDDVFLFVNNLGQYFLISDHTIFNRSMYSFRWLFKFRRRNYC